MSKGEFPRQTFLSVLDAQTGLRETLHDWAEEDKVPDFEEQKKFRKTYSEATLGLCQNVSFQKIHPAWHGSSLSMILTMLLNSTAPKIKVGSEHEAEDEKEIIPIGIFWEKFLERLDEAVFDNALNLALKISPEKIEKVGKTHSSPRD